MPSLLFAAQAIGNVAADLQPVAESVIVAEDDFRLVMLVVGNPNSNYAEKKGK